MQVNYIIILVILTAGAFTAYKKGKLTGLASFTGWLAGLFVFAGSGYTGVIMMAAFFILGTAATSWKMNLKQQRGLAEKDKGKRTAGQVIANAGVAGILGVLQIFSPGNKDLFVIMIAGSLASAAADTLSSELGNVYGSKFYNIITLQKDFRGSNGVVSVEGTCIGIAGSAAIALIYTISFGFTWNVLCIIIGGTIGNLSDSVLGATFERKNLLDNNGVNFINTLIGSLATMLLYKINNS